MDNKAVSELEIIDKEFSVCKLDPDFKPDPDKEFFFFAKTDDEISLVCPAEDVPKDIKEREDGWKAFRITGVLDFSLIGILSGISGVLAENHIGIFVVSTYDTDYVLVKKENLEKAVCALEGAGYKFI